MAENNQKTLQDFFLEEKEKLDAIERERAMLKAPSTSDMPTMRPTDDMIDRNLGPELSSDQIRTKAQNKAWDKYKQQQAKIEYRKEVEAKNKQREEQMRKDFKDIDKKDDAKKQDKKKPKRADDWAKEQTKKNKQQQEQQKKNDKDKDSGMER